MFRHPAITLVAISLIGLSACDDVPDISLPNEPPSAADDVITIKQNESIESVRPIILANDFDIDGDPLAIEITADPTNGVVEDINGIIRYTPDLYFFGTDQFTYQITDLVGHTATAVVSIEVAKQETRAIFSAMSDTGRTLLMVDSRDPGTLVNLNQSLDPGETLLNYAISTMLDQAVLLTDADRVLTIALDDPATPVNTFDIDTSNGPVDGGLIVSNIGTTAAYTLDNRYVVYFSLDNPDLDPLVIDTGFDAGSTMMPTVMVPLDPPEIFNTGVVMQGTLGSGADERGAIYTVPLSTTVGPFATLDDEEVPGELVTRPVFGSNSMLWLTLDLPDDNVVPPDPPYSCTSPPLQLANAVSYARLGTTITTDLNATSGLLTAPTSLISYNYAHSATSILVAACPPDVDIVQIIEIPFVSAETAQVVATADDTSDGLWNIDISNGGQYAIYVLDGDTGLRTIALDLADTDPVVTDLTASLPNFQAYSTSEGLAVPPSVFSDDGLRWLYLAPVSDALTRLEWMELATTATSTLELPFTATNLLSDGFFALVQGETGDTGSAPIALIDLQNPAITTVDVDGTLAESLTDPLNQIESAIQLYPVP